MEGLVYKLFLTLSPLLLQEPVLDRERCTRGKMFSGQPVNFGFKI